MEWELGIALQYPSLPPTNPDPLGPSTTITSNNLRDYLGIFPNMGGGLPNSMSFRPLTVSFLIRASGKETDTATPLGLEKYGRTDFTLGRWVPTDPKTPKWI